MNITFNIPGLEMNISIFPLHPTVIFKYQKSLDEYNLLAIRYSMQQERTLNRELDYWWNITKDSA